MRLLDEYWSRGEMSQSVLKKICNAGGTDDSPDTKSSFRGSAIDVYLTQPEYFDDIYHMGNVSKKPSEAIEKIIKSLSLERELEDQKDEILQACKEEDYYGNRNDSFRINTIIEKGADYFKDLRDGGDKIVLSLAEKFELDQIKNIVHTHPTTAKYFKNSLVVEIKFQTAHYHTINGVPSKGLTDIEVVNHQEGWVKEIDIKSTGVTRNEFGKVAKSFRYDFQKAWYKELMRQTYPNYRIINGSWLVIPRPINKVFIQECTDFDYKVGRYGGLINRGTIHTEGEEGIMQNSILGWEQCLEIYKQSKELNLVDYDIEYYRKNGLIKNKSLWLSY